MAYLNLNKFHYFGFDESPIGGNSSGLVLACTETDDSRLIEKRTNLLKAADYIHLIREGEEIVVPSLFNMGLNGLSSYSWIRSNRGRSFCRQRAAHASIAQLLMESEVDPRRMVVYIDEFFPPEYTKELLVEYMQRFYGVNLPRPNIQVIPGADRSIPLVNFADILAYRIAASFRRTQNCYTGPGQRLPMVELFSEQIVASDQRVSTVAEEGRETLAFLLSA
ncbi:hypothetical protein CL619_04995 [archaeon]|nr:hypothetical protein [archaeon]